MGTDVLIVGGGPTGLVRANQLGRRSVRATITGTRLEVENVNRYLAERHMK